MTIMGITPRRTTDHAILAAFRRNGEWIELTQADLLHRLRLKTPDDRNAAAAALFSMAVRGLVASASRYGLAVYHVTDAGKAMVVG
jgi:hypothetical protein